MKTPEMELPVLTNLPIQLEYTGNYSNIISLNEPILRQLIDIIGTPKTTLVIKDDNNLTERLEIRKKAEEMLRNPFLNNPDETPDIESFRKINNNRKKKQYEVLIDSKLIYTFISESSPNRNYEIPFLQILEAIIVDGIQKWAFYEAEEKGFSNIFKNMRKKQQLEKFFLEQSNHFLFKDSIDKRNKKK